LTSTWGKPVRKYRGINQMEMASYHVLLRPRATNISERNAESASSNGRGGIHISVRKFNSHSNANFPHWECRLKTRNVFFLNKNNGKLKSIARESYYDDYDNFNCSANVAKKFEKVWNLSSVVSPTSSTLRTSCEERKNTQNVSFYIMDLTLKTHFNPVV
jgi:hypothetical protein